MALIGPNDRLTLVCDPEADKDPLSDATRRARAHAGTPWTLELKPSTWGHATWEPVEAVGADVFALTLQDVSDDNPRYLGKSQVWHYKIVCPVCEVNISASHNILGPMLGHAARSGEELPLLVVSRMLEDARLLQRKAILDWEDRRLNRFQARRVTE